MYDGRPLLGKWEKTNKKKYQEKGYVFTNYGEIFNVSYDTALSVSEITTICDYCGEEIKQQFRTYIQNKERSLIKKDACKLCWNKKMKETMLIKYGKENASCVTEIKNKREETFIERFGVTTPLKLDNIKEQIKKTNLEKYGYEHMMKIPGEANRRIELACKTMYINGNGVCSSQQEYINEVLLGKLNYPVGPFKLDIAFPEKMVYVEYDRSGHELQVILGNKTQKEFDELTRKRYYVLKNIGWKMIKIISSKDKLLSKELLKYYFFLACGRFKYIGHNYFELNLDNMTYTYAGETKSLGFKNTKRIMKQNRIQ